MSRHLSFTILICLALIVALFVNVIVVPARPAAAATVLEWIAQLPANNDVYGPIYTQSVHVWINSNTTGTEKVILEYRYGAITKEITGTLDSSYPAANWRADIPPLPVGTVVVYRLFVRDQAGVVYLPTAFGWPYRVKDLPSYVEVDDSWAGSLPGSDLGGGHNFGGNAFATIQDGINGVTTPGTIRVNAGTYTEAITIPKPVTLLGPNDIVDPNSTEYERAPEAIVIPATSDPDPYSPTAVTIMSVTANDVTLKGFTLDGNNPALTSTIRVNGVDVDACEALAGYGGNLVVENNIIQNTACSAIDFDNQANGGGATTNNYINHNRIDNIGYITYDLGIGILLAHNFYADVIGNVLTRVRVGLQTDNFSQANPALTASLSDNQITSTRQGIFHNLAYGSASPFQLNRNILAVENETGASHWDGIMLASLTGTASPTVLDNIIDASSEVSQTTVGYQIWNDPTTIPLTVSGGSVTGADYGVWVNNYDGHPPQSGQPYINSDTQITFVRMTIDKAALAGLYVKDNPVVTTTASVQATLQDVRMSQSTVNVQVEGTDASAVVKGSTFADATTIFSLTNGTLIAYANNLTGTIGLHQSNGTANLAHNWWGTYNVQPSGLSAAAWQTRLGAEIVDLNPLAWAEGDGTATLGDASLSGGSGTAVIVAHGHSYEDAPFGNVTLDSMCSNYYDFFTVNGNGNNWSVSVPVDDTPECNTQTLAAKKIYWIPAGTNYDTECTPFDNTACWDLITTPVSIAGQNLIVPNLTPSQLGGTPFVAGSDTGTDPTAVAVVAFTATPDRASAPAGVILVSALVAIGIVIGGTVLVLRRRR